VARRTKGLAAVIAATALAGGPGAFGANAAGPEVTAAPTVIGTAAAGKILTGLSGAWAGFGAIAYHFQWYRCNAAGSHCLSVHGATSPSYTAGGKDVGKTIGLTVSGTDSTGTASAYSSLVGPIAPPRPLLESTAQPVVSGAPLVGKTLEVTTGTWSPAPGAITYVWERCNANGRACAAIARATSSSYVVVQADLGHALLAVVQATNGTAIQYAFSTASPAVVDGSVLGPVLVAGPTLGGLAVENQDLLATTGIWKAVGTVTFGFRWYRCNATGSHCSLVGNATQSAYHLGPRDVGKTIALTLRTTDSTGTRVGYASIAGPVAAAGTPLTPTTLPTISGAATAGGDLSVGRGLWSTTPSGYAYAWLRCNRNGRRCVAVARATRASYHATHADTGHTLVAEVTATAGGVSQAALTVATTPVS